MRAAITGITGFAGQYLAEHLLAEGDQVLGFNRSGAWPEHTLARVEAEAPLFPWDVTLPALAKLAYEPLRIFAPEVIFHLAAISVPEECGPHLPAGPAAAVNVGGTAAVLEMAASLPRPPRVLFISTSHVYDAVAGAGDPVSETSPIKPKNGYGWSKSLAETVIGWFTRDSGLDVMIARSFQHTGPRQHEQMMLPQWARQFAQPGGRPIEVFNRSTRIDLSDVRDIVRAYRLLALAGEPNGLYNVGSGQACQTGEVLAMLERIADPHRPIRELHPGVRADAVADISRLVATTGWQPRISLQQCVADTFEFWQNHEAEMRKSE